MGFQTSVSNAPAIGYSGQLVGDDQDIITMKNVEVSASMPFGIAVAFKRSSPVSDMDALLPGSETVIAGIVIKTNAYERTWTDADGVVHGQLDNTGLVTGTLMNILRAGRILVTCPTGCVPGDRLYVRKDIGEAGEAYGTCENASDESDMVDCTEQGVWESTALAGGLAILNVNFIAKP